MKKISKLVGIALLGLNLAAGVVWAGSDKLSTELRSGNLPAIVDVIVQYKVAPADANYQKVVKLGGALHDRIEVIKAARYTIPSTALRTLSDDPEVAFITPNRALKGLLDITAGAVHSDVANSQGLDGGGIGVAVIDSGIADMPDFQMYTSRIVYSSSFVQGGVPDQYGHGTHVAGIIGGNGNGGVYIGIAPAVSLVSLRVLDANGNGTDAGVIQAIGAAISLQTRYNIRVINLSLGRAVFEPAAQDPLCQAVEAAWKAGMVVVVAAGNQGRDNSAGTQGYGTITAPGNDPYVITVGAMKTEGTKTRTDDLIASYSSKGPTLFDHYVKPDLVAPGNRVVSTMPGRLTLSGGYPQNHVSGSYFTLSGTSMASAVVSGAAALLLQKNPQLGPDQVKARLMRTATRNFPVSSVGTDPATGTHYTSYYDIFTIGAGYLDITAALADTTLAPGAALSPSASYDTAKRDVVLNCPAGLTGLWGTNITSGTNVISGASKNVVWGSNVVWGAGAAGTTAFSVVWGTNVVWSAAQPYGEILSIDGEQ
jgi:serine protease AprX